MASFDTLRIRAGYDSREHNHAVNVPIYQSVAFDLESPDRATALWSFEEADAIYSRVGNPTVTALENRLIALDGAHSAVALGSGMAAVSYVVLALTEGGGNIVVSPALYGGSEDAFSHFYRKFGVDVRFARDRHDVSSYVELIDEDTRGIYVESISNPNAELVDVDALAEAAHSHGVPLIVDNTVATPYLFRPLEHGADVVVYSATKGIGGHGSTLGGIVLDAGRFEYTKERFPQFYEPSYKLKDRAGNRRSPAQIDPAAPLVIHIRAFYLEFIGAAIGPFEAFLLIQGLDTISERLSKESASARRIAEYLDAREDVPWVSYPTLKSSPYRNLAERDFTHGAGQLLTFGFPGSEEQLPGFLASLRYFSYHVNIGDVRSLIVNSPKTTHAELDAEHQRRAGIAPDTLRISVGLEDPDDLIADLGAALDAIAS